MDSPLLQRLVGTLITSLLLYLMGVMSAHAPALGAMAQSLIDAAGGMTVVTTGIAGFVIILGFALYRRLVSYWKLHVATVLPAGAAIPKDVDQVYKEASYKDILTMNIPSQGAARSMLIRSQK